MPNAIRCGCWRSTGGSARACRARSPLPIARAAVGHLAPNAGIAAAVDYAAQSLFRDNAGAWVAYGPVPQAAQWDWRRLRGLDDDALARLVCGVWLEQFDTHASGVRSMEDAYDAAYHAWHHSTERRVSFPSSDRAVDVNFWLANLQHARNKMALLRRFVMYRVAFWHGMNLHGANGLRVMGVLVHSYFPDRDVYHQYSAQDLYSTAYLIWRRLVDVGQSGSHLVLAWPYRPDPRVAAPQRQATGASHETRGVTMRWGTPMARWRQQASVQLGSPLG